MASTPTARLGLALLAAFTLALDSAWAQSPTGPPAEVGALTSQVPRWIQSSDRREAAWGAYLAAQHMMSGAIPLLVEALRRVSPADNRGEESSWTAAVLDALIQLDARLDPVVVRPFLSRWSVQMLLLLDRDLRS